MTTLACQHHALKVLCADRPQTLKVLCTAASALRWRPAVGPPRQLVSEPPDWLDWLAAPATEPSAQEVPEPAGGCVCDTPAERGAPAAQPPSPLGAVSAPSSHQAHVR